ncbi:MAG: hypothetical protein KJ990_04625 [Proteobacteria bacterium]|nr:hypothetical protein [Pseudomonadota bacterium]MBU1649984.1 hypothetical protein [Pseudomonadota bacterium]
MTINIPQGPPADIFKNRRKYIVVFVALLSLACCGLLIGVYAIFVNTNYYNQLETLALVFIVAPSPFAVYVGEMLQEYKKLTPPQYEELAAFGQQYPEVKRYCDLVTMANRQPVRAEYEACQDWVEEVSRSAK